MKTDTNPRELPEITYDPPQIEQVLSPAEIEREVHYAGETSDELTPR